MSGLTAQATGFRDLDAATKKIARLVSPPNLANALAEGAEVIKLAAQDNIVAQGLVDSWDLHDSARVIKSNQYRVDVMFSMVYAAIHEYGGVVEPTVTDRARRYFWAMWYKTGNDMWRAMALTTKKNFVVRIPARPYLRPAVDEYKFIAVEAVRRRLANFLEAL